MQIFTGAVSVTVADSASETFTDFVVKNASNKQLVGGVTTTGSYLQSLNGPLNINPAGNDVTLGGDVGIGTTSIRSGFKLDVQEPTDQRC